MKRLFVPAEPPEGMHLLGLLMIHDILPWPAYIQPAPFTHWWAVQDAFGFDDTRLEFLPYWKNGDLVKLSPESPNVVCSMYRRAGKLMLIVMNNTDEDRDVALQLDTQKLGLPALENGMLLDAWQATGYSYHSHDVDDKGKVKAKPEAIAVPGREVKIAVVGGKATLSVPKRSFRVLVAGN